MGIVRLLSFLSIMTLLSWKRVDKAVGAKTKTSIPNMGQTSHLRPLHHNGCQPHAPGTTISGVYPRPVTGADLTEGKVIFDAFMKGCNILPKSPDDL